MSESQAALALILLIIVVPIGLVLRGLVKMEYDSEISKEEEWKKLLGQDDDQN